MALSIFDDRATPPTEQTLAQALGRAAKAWGLVKEQVERQCTPFREEWAFAGARFGSSLRLKRAERVIVYMTPGRGHFLASFVLGEKACAAAREARLPAGVLALIAEAKKYAEGRGIRIPVKTARDASAVGKLAAIKVAH
jgi:hypothetical protein